MPRHSKIETAKSLASSHKQVEPAIQEVYILEPIDEGNPAEPVKLLEIVDGTLEVGIKPIAFTAAPSHGIDFPSIVVEVSPREFGEIRSGSLNLGRNWFLGSKVL